MVPINTVMSHVAEITGQAFGLGESSFCFKKTNPDFCKLDTKQLMHCLV